jgi:hypothetical protein
VKGRRTEVSDQFNDEPRALWRRSSYAVVAARTVGRPVRSVSAICAAP